MKKKEIKCDNCKDTWGTCKKCLQLQVEQAGVVIIPDRSNGPKGLTQPKDCHCHCAIPIVNAWHDSGLAKHKHPGKGGWWKNDDCLICKK